MRMLISLKIDHEYNYFLRIEDKMFKRVYPQMLTHAHPSLHVSIETLYRDIE